MHYKITPSILKGTLTPPASKSHTLRAILFASLANGKSTIHHYLHSPDTKAMIHACRNLGATIDVDEHFLSIQGVNGSPTATGTIDSGNSGQVLRFIGAVAALGTNEVTITGDASIKTRRPVTPLIEGLKQMGAIATSNQGSAPISIKGPLFASTLQVDGSDSQPISALLMAATFCEGKSLLHVKNPGEKPWVALTLDWLRRLGVSCGHRNFTEYWIEGRSSYPGFEYTVPADFSSVAFPIAAALITGSELTITGIDFADSQGDKKVIQIMQEMGGKIVENKKNSSLLVKPSKSLNGVEVDINDTIDALPILAVLACFSKGKTRLKNAAIARKKESDRISAMANELRAMGADLLEKPDGLLITGRTLKGAIVNGHKDHRVAMAMSVAGLGAKGETLVKNVDCINKSYQTFLRDFQSLGAQLEEIKCI